MLKHRHTETAAVLLMALAVIAVAAACVSPSVLALASKRSAPSYALEMDKTKILDIQIIAVESQWEDMLENAQAEEYIPATVIINGERLENVGVRPKGNSSLSMVARDSTTDRYSLKLEFDHYIDGQTWLGLDKLALNNMMGDASYMKEYLSYDIMSYIGVDNPLFSFADISVNGGTWGFYLAVECLEESFAQRVYGNNHGKLYKPEGMGMRGNGRMNEFVRDMQPPQSNNVQGRQIAPDAGNAQGRQIAPDAGNAQGGAEGAGRGAGFGGMASGGVSLQYTDDAPENYSAIFENAVFDASDADYRRVIKALKTLSAGGDLESAVEIEAVLRYFAAHTTVVNLDSYVTNMAHNYYLYEKNGRLTILPWDYNLAFGGFQSRDASSVVNFPIDTPVSGVSLDDRPLIGKLLENEEYSALYHSYLERLVNEYFDGKIFERTIDFLYSEISSYVENDSSAFFGFEVYKKAVPELKKLGLLRAESIKGQLAGDIPSTTEAQNANPDRLKSSSDIDLSLLGSQGGGGFGGGINREMNGVQGMDRQLIESAMEIIRESDGGELTQNQQERLKELGITDAQAKQLADMAQGGFGGFENFEDFGVRRQDNVPQAGNRPPFGQPAGINEGQSAAFGYSADTLLTLGGTVLAVSAGLLFVVKFKRRSA